ncbi:hypothetical protein GIB67_010564 [Kingdonia uniflora]|uniref:Transposase MuDR plant domain-containing protein n=1 Tax=Kingdonia uniflora TaxID=39325 RepID=A0A7J7MB42_9MAGN|nr:hypothetical protein GIB67_010564 [Kingdonia uniflora]
MVKKNSKMQLRDEVEVGNDDSNPITVSDNTVDDYPPPDLEETRMRLSIPKPRHTYDLRDVFINYGGKWCKMSPTGWVENDYKWGKSFKFRILCGEGINYGEFVRDIADKGDESYSMRTHVYIKPTDVVRKIVDEAGEYVLLEEDEIDYIISPRETKKKNTTPVKATPVKKDAKRKGKAVAANKPAKRQKNVELSDSEELDALPEVYQSDKEIDPEEITDYGIETPVNMVAESESECDDIDEEQERWVRYAQVGIDCLGDEDGYYSTHSSDDEDYVPTAEDLERGDDFEGVDVELDDIYSKEEDGRVKTPLEVGFKQLEVGMQWATVYEAREHMRRFGIVNHFTYISIKNDLTRLRFNCSEENCEWLVFISRNNDGHTMVLRHGNFQHSCEGSLCNAPWVARKVEALVRDVRAMTPKAIKTRMKTKFGIEISYWTAWNARQICIESIVGSYDQGYNELPSLCVEILKSNPGSIPPYVVDLPPLQRGRGRPRKERIRDDEVNKVQKKCGKCGAFGHNKKTCKGEPIQIQSAPAPKTRGRPSKKTTKAYFSQSQQSDVTQVQTTPIAGGVESSGRASNVGRGKGRSASTPIAGGVQTTPIARGRGSSGRASNVGRGRGRSASTPIAGGVQTTPIAGGRGSSGRESNAGRGRGRSASIPIVGQVQTRSMRAFNAGGVQTRSGKSSNVGRGWGSSEGATSPSNAGRGRGRAMQTNHQKFVDEWLSNSVPVEAPQSQERPPLVIPPIPPKTDAPVKPYKKAFKPPRQNWRL